MSFIEMAATPGEHPLIVPGGIGSIESIVTVPEVVREPFVACIGHPHSLQGGSMHNKVVTTLARVFKELGIPSIRFNFRGVGQTAGVYDAGIGESDDMITLVHAWQKEYPQSKLLFAGFSFGSYVAYRAAAQLNSELLITVAPPVHHYNYHEYPVLPKSWLIIQGDADEVVPYSDVKHFAQHTAPPIPMLEFSNTGHFFHGKLIELKTRLTEYVLTQGIL